MPAGIAPPARRPRGRRLTCLAALGLSVALGACGAHGTAPTGHPVPTPPTGAPAPASLYAHTAAGMFAPQTRSALPRVYVPNLRDGTVSVIDPTTYQVIDTYKTGAEPQHVVPSWDLRTLYVNNNAGDSLTPIDPTTGKPGAAIAVRDPYNLYFTPDGRSALVMAEADTNIDFRDPHTFALQYRLHLGDQCAGVNHADFSPDGSYLIATCEYAGRLVKVDLTTRRVTGWLDLGRSAGPQDIKIDPYGKTWYVADFNRNGLWEVGADPLAVTGFLPTGPETHGLYPSRDGRYLYVANRGGHLIPGAGFSEHTGDNGSVSVVDFATRQVVATWAIPGGGTPDMGNVSADGKTLWLSGRRSDVVYVFDTVAGKLIREIKVGREPHGLCVWPLPGRYSLGHTGILR